MENFELQISIPISADNYNGSAEIARKYLALVVETLKQNTEVEQIKVKLPRMGDRNAHNFLEINENGHASSKKTVIDL